MNSIEENDLNRINREFVHNIMCLNIRKNLFSKSDLTPRQIEWCRAHIPAFAEMQRLMGVK